MVMKVSVTKWIVLNLLNLHKDMKLELNKEEAALVEQLVETHIDMLEDDSNTEIGIWTRTDLKEARALHYKLLKFFRS